MDYQEYEFLGGELEKSQKRVEELEEALRRIENLSAGDAGWARRIARTVLNRKD